MVLDIYLRDNFDKIRPIYQRTVIDFIGTTYTIKYNDDYAAYINGNIVYLIFKPGNLFICKKRY